MDVSQLIDLSYDLIRSGLMTKFGDLGYAVSEEKHSDPLYESRYIQWSNNQEAIRLTWDGNENAFLVATTTDIPISPLTRWTAISKTKLYFENADLDYSRRIAAKVMQSVS